MAILPYLTTTIFDFGAIGKLPRAMADLGIKRPLLVTDKGLMAVGVAATVRTAMGEEVPVTIFDGTPENPTEEAVLEALSVFRGNDCDGVVGLGGGSSMDLGRAVAFLATNDVDLCEMAPLDRGKYAPIAPYIAVPTTSGTGSEVSNGFVVITRDGRKRTLVSPRFLAGRAICDPDLTLGLPPRLTAATGMDAVTHGIEAILSPVVNPPAEAIALDAIERAIAQGYLERAVADGSDREARWHMMMASTSAALAFSKGLGSIHAMAHSAGRLKDLRLHHGTLNAVIMPVVLRYNADHAADKYVRIRHALRLGERADLADMVENLNARLGLPRNLSEMGLTTARIPELVPEAVDDLATVTNPVQPSADDYERLFEEAITK
ncbi:MAG: iron-containing alcohol dehydrogenase [Alphaproteobacteria bacterium]